MLAPPWTHYRSELLASLLLAVCTLAAYAEVCGYNFVNVDDEEYVTENPAVRAGLTGPSLAWAWTSFHAANWHPLTWMSLQLDAQIYQVNARGFHLTNLLWHLANVLLLFAVLRRLTGAVWRSAFVAAFFALHPLHVESVAWISERKDVLSTFFALLTLGAYARYAEQPGAGRYLLVVLFLALGLLAKPMLVTLPLLLLLLDYWPLRRWRPARWAAADTSGQGDRLRSYPLSFLLLEKVPLLVLVLASCVLTLIAQKQGGAVSTLQDVPLTFRIANALIAYATYLAKTFWPSRLTVMYHLQSVTVAQVAVASVVLAVISVLVLALARSRPYLLVGWLWFVGMLVPVIGLVQVGAQALADRYTYLPHIGLFLLLVWGAHDLLGRWNHGRVLGSAAASLLLLACLVLTWSQVGYWRDPFTLWSHALEIDPNNYDAHRGLGRALLVQGKLDEAAVQLTEAVRCHPQAPDAHCNLGKIRAEQGQLEEAEDCFTQALRLDPHHAEALIGLGLVREDQGKWEQAADCFRQALRLQPQMLRYHCELAFALQKQGQQEQARAEYREASKLQPRWPEAASDEAWNLATNPLASARNGKQALKLAEEVCLASEVQRPQFLDTLAASHAELGQFDQAVGAAREALQLAKAAGQEDLASQIQARLLLYEHHQPYRESPAD